MAAENKVPAEDFSEMKRQDTVDEGEVLFTEEDDRKLLRRIDLW